MKKFRLIFFILLIALNIFNTGYASEKRDEIKYDEIIIFNAGSASEKQDEIKYDEIICDSKNFCYPAIIKRNNKYGIIDKYQGGYRTVVPTEYDLITKTLYSNDDTYIVKKQNKYGLLFFDGLEQKIEVLLNDSYDDIKYINNTRYYIVKKDNKYQLYDFEARKLKGYFDDVIQTKQGGYEYIIVNLNNKYGVHYISGRLKNYIIECEFDSIEPLNYHDIFKLEKDGKYAIYNAITKISTGFIYDKKTTNIECRCDYFIINENGKYSLYYTNLHKSKYIIQNCDEISELKHGWELFKIRKGSKYALYRTTAIPLYDDIKDLKKYLNPIENLGFRLQFIYDDIQDGNDMHYILVKRYNKWGRIYVMGEENAVGLLCRILGITAL